MADHIRIRCQRCGRRYKVKALVKKLRRLPCPNCGHLIDVPRGVRPRGLLRTLQATVVPKAGEIRPDLAEIVRSAMPGAVAFKKAKVPKASPARTSAHRAAQRARSVLQSAGTYGVQEQKPDPVPPGLEDEMTTSPNSEDEQQELLNRARERREMSASMVETVEAATPPTEAAQGAGQVDAPSLSALKAIRLKAPSTPASNEPRQETAEVPSHGPWSSEPPLRPETETGEPEDQSEPSAESEPVDDAEASSPEWNDEPYASESESEAEFVEEALRLNALGYVSVGTFMLLISAVVGGLLYLSAA